MVAKILAVDDDQIMRMMLELILEETGAYFKVVGSGEEALKELKKDNYNYLLSDLNLPQMDGFELAKNIHEYLKKHNKEIKIFAFTASNLTKDLKNKCNKAGFEEVLIKGFTSSDLIRIMKI